MTILAAVAQVAVGVVFLWSPVPKLLDFGEFRRGILLYSVVPKYLATALAGIIVVAEAAVGLSMVTGIGLVGGASAGMGLLFVFGVAVSVNLVRGRTLPCFCSGASHETPISVRTLVKIVVLALGVVLSLGSAIRSTQPIPWARVHEVLEAGPLFVWSATCIQLSMWVLSMPEIVALVKRTGFKAERRVRHASS